MKIILIAFIGILGLVGCSTTDPVPNDKVQYCDETTSYNDCYSLGRYNPLSPSNAPALEVVTPAPEAEQF